MMTDESKKYNFKFKTNKSRYQRLIPSLSSPKLRDWRDIIEDYIEISRKRKNNKVAMFYLQKNLLMDIMVCESSIKLFKEIIKNPEKANDYTKEKIENIESQKGFWEQELEANKTLVSAFKYIGDGILWRFLKYDTPVIFAMSFIDDSGPIEFDQGKVNEFYELGNCIYDNSIKNFAYHGITHFGRLGDLTTVDYDDKIEFVEVKSNKNIRGSDFRDRINKQNQRLNNLTDFANERKGFIEENKIYINDINEEPKTQMKKLKKLLYKSKVEGICFENINSYLSILIDNFGAYDEAKFKDSNEHIMELVKAEKSDKMLIVSSLDYLEFSKIKTPITIFPFDSEIIADILVGKIIISYFFNITNFLKEVEKNGWIINDSVLTKENIDPKKDYFCLITKNDLTIGVPPSTINKLIFELYSLDSFLKIFDNLLLTQDRTNKLVIHRFVGEEKLWR